MAATGDPALTGLPNNAAGFARAIVRLRNRLAPNVVAGLAPERVWGTKNDPTYSNPSRDARRLAARSAKFYRSLHARFDVVFHDVADRDAGFRRHVLGDRAPQRWTAGDFHRSDRYIRGFTRLTQTQGRALADPAGQPEALPTPGPTTATTGSSGGSAPVAPRTCAQARRAGIVACLFGGGADGTTHRGPTAGTSSAWRAPTCATRSSAERLCQPRRGGGPPGAADTPAHQRASARAEASQVLKPTWGPVSLAWLLSPSRWM